MIKTVGGVLGMIGCTVAANLLLKAGAMVPPTERVFFELISWKMVLGIFAYALAAVIYTWLLHWVPLNVAQSFAAAQFIAVILAAAVVFSEGIPMIRWIGILLIASGIALVGLTSDLDGADDTILDARDVN